MGQLEGLRNNVKGIYHELRYAERENSDSDFYTVELFDQTNHPGADVTITNTLTGETREVQLKATDYASYIREHNERYGNIDIFVTDEVAETIEGVTPTGFSNQELEDDVERVLSKARDADDNTIGDSIMVAGMILLARNVRVLLSGKRMSTAQKEAMIRDGVISCSVAGLVSYIIG